MIRRRFYQVAIFCAVVLAAGCDEWDDHNRLQEEGLNKNLLQAIDERPELSKFLMYLKITGYDKVLEASKTFTVWAPDNDALSLLPTEVVADVEKLTQFVGNHITYQEYYLSSATEARLKMLSGKNLNWNGVSLEYANVTSGNQIARNGVLHIVNNPVTVEQNTWEIFAGSEAGQKHLAYINSLTYDFFVDSLGTQIGVDPATGEPIYQPGTGYITKNYFFDDVYDISNEDSLSTFIVLTDAAFDAELAKLAPYFKTVTMDQDSTDSLASWHLAKDLVIRGLIKPEELPDTLISVDGVKVPIDKTAIVETHMTSNGIVYVMNKVDFKLAHKFPPVIIEGENPDAFSRTDKSVNIHYRYREWASGDFDLRVYNHGIAQFNVRYDLDKLHAATYKVYMRRLNDFVDTTFTGTDAHLDAFQEKLVLESRPTYTLGTPSPGALKDFGYAKVNRIKTTPESQGYKYLGEYTHTDYKRLYLFVVANNSTDNRLNAIEVDYIKLVPVFN
jgi:uncharacterized surface protein with fasciclin (FAS1) repeats